MTEAAPNPVGSATFDSELSNAYRDAAILGADMRQAANALERMRAAATMNEDPWAIGDVLNGIVNEYVGSHDLALILGRIRDAWSIQETLRTIGHINTRLRADAIAGLGAWVVGVGNAVAGFRFDVARAIAAAPLPLPPDTKWVLTKVVAQCGFAMDARWREAQPLLADLGEDDRLPALSRSRVLSFLAEIYLVIRTDKTAAAAALRRAEALAPEDWRVAFVGGRLREQENTPETTEAACVSFEKAAKAAPFASSPQVELGLLLLKQDNIAAAESRFLAAASCALSPQDGYEALIDLFGRPQLFPSRSHEIASLVERAGMVERSKRGADYDAMLSAARAFQANGSEREALDWLQTAISFDTERITAYIDRGFLHLDKHRFDEALADFTRVVKTAPGSADGHWGMLNLSEATNDWICLLRSAARCLRRAPEWLLAIRERLEATALALYTTHGKPKLAQGYYRFLRRRLGAEYEASYRNLNGNLMYFGANYRAAAKEYRYAERASPGEARYPANRALALEAALAAEEETTVPSKADVAAGQGAESLDQAIAATLLEATEGAERAVALDPESTEFQNLHARLTRAHRFVVLHGAAARHLVPDAYRLRVLIHPDLTPLVTDRGSLAPVFIEQIDKLRNDVAADVIFTLAAVRVKEMALGQEPEGTWAIELGGKRVTRDHFDPTASSSGLVDQIICRIRQLLPRLLGLDEAREIARKRPDGETIAAVPAALVEFTLAAREMLRKQGRIEPNALKTPLGRADFPGPCSIDDAPLTRLAIRVASGDPLRNEIGVSIQRTVFLNSGVIVPQIEIVDDAKIPFGHWALEVGTSGLPALTGESTWAILAEADMAIVSAILSRARDLMGPASVDHQLDFLDRAAPALIFCVRSLLPMPVLLAALRLRLEEKNSNLGLLGLLEDWVIDWGRTNEQFGKSKLRANTVSGNFVENRSLER